MVVCETTEIKSVGETIFFENKEWKIAHIY